MSSGYEVLHRAEPWTALRENTSNIIVHARYMPSVTTARQLDAHFRRCGFLACAYHYVITGAGISVTRHPDSIGAATETYDRNSVYVALLGFDPKNDPLPSSYQTALKQLLADLTARHPEAEILSAPELMKLEGYDAFNSFISRERSRHHARRQQ